jgi:tetratricopeptide (TPR) repeat protein
MSNGAFSSLLKYSFIIVLLLSCKSKNDYLSESNRLVEKHKYKEAIGILNKAIKQYPNFREAFLNRGLCYEDLKDLSSAIASYRDLLKIDKNNTAAFYHIGTCKYDQNLFQESIDNFTMALQTKGYDTSGKSSFIINWSKNGLIEDSKFDILGDEIFFQRGWAFYQLNKLKSAYNDFSNCLRGNYRVTDSHYMIALCYYESGNREKACAELDKAILFGDTLSIKKKQEICK